MADSGGAGERVGAAAHQADSAAANVRDHAADAAVAVKERAGTELSDIRDEARDHARGLAHEARDRLSAQADDTTRRLASTVAAAGGELRRMAERSDQPDGAVTGVVRQLADRADGLAQRLERDGYRGVAQDAARLGRNRPGLFLLAAGAAGFAAGRLLRNTDTGALTEAVKGEPGSAGAGDLDAAAGDESRPGAVPRAADVSGAPYGSPVGRTAGGGS
jgi:hypothetical protein